MARRALAAVAVLGIAAVGLTACSGSKGKAASEAQKESRLSSPTTRPRLSRRLKTS